MTASEQETLERLVLVYLSENDIGSAIGFCGFIGEKEPDPDTVMEMIARTFFVLEVCQMVECFTEEGRFLYRITEKGRGRKAQMEHFMENVTPDMFSISFL